MAIDNITLLSGSHDTREDGMCLLEAVAYIAGEEHSDCPECVSPVLVAYGQQLNDWMSYEQRQSLVKFIPFLVGTANPELEKKRVCVFVDAAVRVFVPQALEDAGLKNKADKLRELPEIVDVVTAKVGENISRDSGDIAARSAMDSVRDSARCASRSSSWAMHILRRPDVRSYSWERAAMDVARDSARSARYANTIDEAISAFKRAIEVRE